MVPSNWSVSKLALFLVFALPVVAWAALKFAAILTGVGGLVLATDGVLVAPFFPTPEQIDAKRAKVEKFMAISREQGVLTDGDSFVPGAQHD